MKPPSGAAADSTSKAAALLLARGAALELAKAKPYVRVNAVLPAAVRTPLWNTMPFYRELVVAKGGEDAVWDEWSCESGLGRVAEPEDVANAVQFLLSEQARHFTGSKLTVDGGCSAG